MSAAQITKFLSVIVILFQYSVIGRHTKGRTDRIPFTGPCKSRAWNYCDQHVANSVCNPQRDECFCRLGYVAIREADEIVCRTLLTDLSCRIDTDCTHVEGSICHPGAGKCVCPGGTVFVEVLHACRSRIWENQTDLCKNCISVGGICFAHRDSMISGNGSTSPVVINGGTGCQCGSKRYSEVERKEHVDDMRHQVCPFELVDIDESCDQSVRLCRSRSAQCILFSAENVRSVSRFATCQCSANHVPVYQTYLHYHECFPKVKSNGMPSCSHCELAGGVCYDSDNDGLSNGCQCPIDRSHLTLPDWNSAPTAGLCGRHHVFTKCTESQLRVCYIPHNAGPYENLTTGLKENKCTPIIGANSANQTFCQLKSFGFQQLAIGEAKEWYREEPNIYCIQFILDEFRPENCGVQLATNIPCDERNSRGRVSYNGAIFIRGDSSTCGPAVRLQIPFECDSSTTCGQIRSATVKSAPAIRSLPRLSIVNIHNQEVRTANEHDQIRLQLTAMGNSSTFTVNFCFIIRRNNKQTDWEDDEWDLHHEITEAVHYRRCGGSAESPKLSNRKFILLSDNLWPQLLASSPVQQSRPFELPDQNSDVRNLLFMCHLHMCTREVNECMLESLQMKMCNWNLQTVNETGNRMVSANLQVFRSNTRKFSSCPVLLCLSLEHIFLVCLALILLNFLICGVLIWTYRCRNKNMLTTSTEDQQRRSKPVHAASVEWTAPIDRLSDFVEALSPSNMRYGVPNVHNPPSVIGSQPGLDQWTDYAQPRSSMQLKDLSNGCLTQSYCSQSHTQEFPYSPYDTDTFDLSVNTNGGKHSLFETRSRYLEHEII